MVAAAVGAMATFDPTRKLWVPGLPSIASNALGDGVLTIVSGASAWSLAKTKLADASVPRPVTAFLIDEQLELNDLALRFAKAMADRLETHPALVLRQITCQHAGHIDLSGLLTLDDGRRGRFEPNPRRIVANVHGQTNQPAIVAADDMRWKCEGFDAFAPVSTELRPGVQFNDSIVGVATDPESGVSARAIRYTNWNGGSSERVTAFELAGGTWEVSGSRRAARRWGRWKTRKGSGRLARTYLAPELVDESAWDAVSDSRAFGQEA